MASVIALVEIEPSNSVKSDSNALLSYPHQGRTQSQVDRAPQQLNSVPGRSSEAIEEDSRQARGGRALLLGLQMTLVMTTNSFTSGLITIGVGEMAKDLELDQSLVFWPVLAYTLTASPLLLPIGSIADVVGPRSICLAGCLGCGIFVLACGLAKNGAELIAFRCLQGVAAALFLPTSMSIISSSIASGKLRNVALATLAFGQVLGFGLGLVAGGVLLGTVGWRVGYYTCGAMQIALFFLGFWSIPSSVVSGATTTVLGMLQKLRDEIDWALYPVAVDIVFLTSALIISESFPERDQALAGAVFNTIANLGQSLGLAVIAVVTNAVTQGQSDAQSVQGLLEGYRAGFWTSFVWMIMAAAVGALGLRKVGKVGVKRD
ncbi:hypothetical protein MMC10_007838 [Thelotrema lepadinum]|nr:hypothetical protein [Thelotrema lepadinum]